MNYKQNGINEQLNLPSFIDYLKIPSFLCGFKNESTTVEKTCSGRIAFCFHGTLADENEEEICTCGAKMHINNHYKTVLSHLPFGGYLSKVIFNRKQYFCPHCGKTRMQKVYFKTPCHRITEELYTYTCDLLASGAYTNKEVAELTGLGKNTVKDIDKKRLQDLYTIDGKALIKPETPVKYLGIDEFKLHNGYRFATHIVDMETGHILWIAGGKKKQVVYDFIEHVGLEWMNNVETIACDMNSDFQEAFEEKCPHIQPVFDYFHVVKNFNEKVVSAVRKDEQSRLINEGKKEAAQSLKKTKYILMSSRSTLQKKDEESKDQAVIHKGSALFKTETVVRKGNYVSRYEELLKDNKLLFTVDLVKEKLTLAYSRDYECEMAKDIIEIMDICKAAGNDHFMWFYNLLDKHWEGIIAHATYKITSSKIEGINNKIKTLRRQAYGYPDDEYFFLKLLDISRKSYVRNPKSHKICD